ncbi:maltose permease [Penicillium atrosanguineum]|nr:maltose permease [Penicillium atrosanguineum]
MDSSSKDTPWQGNLIAEEARRHYEREHTLTLTQAIRKYPMAIFWTLAISTGVLMEGYDQGLLSSFYGFPAFQKQFGTSVGNRKYNISAPWQSGLSQAVHVGQIFGLFINGWAVDRFGYRYTMMLSSSLIAALVFMQFFAPRVEVLLVAELLIGFPLSTFLVSIMVYAAEICPTILRPYLTIYTNLCWSIGKFISSGVLRAFVESSGKRAYKIPMGVQWAWTPVIMVIIILAPESPWYLVHRNRLEDARKALRRFTSNPTETEISKNISMMIHTEEHEKSIISGTSYFDCLKGSNLRRSEIACVVFSFGPLGGAALSGFSTYFFEQAGLSTVYSFDLSIGQNALGFLCGILAYFIVWRIGRRNLVLIGLSGMLICLVIIGGLGVPATTQSLAWVTGGLMYAYVVVNSLSVGPIAGTIVSEIPSVRLRIKTVCLARNAYNVTSIINNILTSYQINETAWNWRGMAGFFWAGSCLLIIWAWFRLPESRDRSLAELDALFEAGTPARAFAKTSIKIGAEESLSEIPKGDVSIKVEASDV